MQPAIDAFKEAGRKIGRSASFKLITIAILILLLLIPSAMVNSLIREREYRKDDVVREISDKWGGSQVVTGPVIMVIGLILVTLALLGLLYEWAGSTFLDTGGQIG